MVLANALKMIHKKTTANRRRYGFKYRSSRFNTTIGFSAVPVGEAVLNLLILLHRLSSSVLRKFPDKLHLFAIIPHVFPYR